MMPSWEDFLLGGVAGGTLVSLIRFLISSRERAKRGPRRDVMANAVELRLSMGPRIVAFGGGTGLSTLLRGLKRFTRNITAVVTVTDEGGSSGRLRQEWGVLPPGDVRNCLVALAEDDSALNRILSFRFDRGELAGHSLGNLILLAATELAGDFRLAVEEMNNLLAIRGRVLPVTTEAVSLAGRTQLGQIVRGELEVSSFGSSLEEIWLEPSDARPLEDVVEAIKEAELLVLGPGSLFTSILPNLLIPDVAKRIRRADVPVVYVSNLMTQPGETESFSIQDHVRWISNTIRRVPDFVLVNSAVIPPDIAVHYEVIGAGPLLFGEIERAALTEMGCAVVEGDFLAIMEHHAVRHDSVRLAEAILRIVRESEEE